MLTDVSPSLREKIILVQSDWQLSGLDDAAATLLATHGAYRRYAAGELLTTAGGLQRDVHIIFEGEVEVRAEGRPPTRFQAPGGVGWVSFLTGEPSVETVALAPCASLLFDTQTMRDFFESNFSLVRNGVRMLSGRLLAKRGGLPAPEGSHTGEPLPPFPARAATLAECMMELREIPIYRKTNIEAVGALALASREVRYEEGDVLWRAGDPADWGLCLRWGRVRCVAPDGRSCSVWPPFVLGMTEVMAEAVRPCDAIAETAVVAYRSQGVHFFGILEDHFDVGMELLSILTRVALIAQ